MPWLMAYHLKCRSTSLWSLVGNNLFLTMRIYWALSYRAYLTRRRKSEWYLPSYAFDSYNYCKCKLCGVCLFRDSIYFSYWLLCLQGCTRNKWGTSCYKSWSSWGIWHRGNSFNCKKVLYQVTWKWNYVELLGIYLCGILSYLCSACAANLLIISTWHLWQGIDLCPFFSENWTVNMRPLELKHCIGSTLCWIDIVLRY